MKVEPEELDVLRYIENHEQGDDSSVEVEVPLEYVEIGNQLEKKDWLLNTWTFSTPEGKGSFALTMAGRSVLAWSEAESLADKTDSLDGGEDPYLPAESPSDCAKRMEKHLDTVKRYIEDGKLRCKKVTQRSWRLHRKDVWELGGKFE